MTIDIDVLHTQHSERDNVFRRHAFERLREAGAVAVTDVVATSSSGLESSQRTLGVLVERGMSIVEEDSLVTIDGLIASSRRSIG